MAQTLRSYQVETCDAIDAAYATGQRRILSELATGLGKTTIAVETIRRRGPRTLWIAHREELLDQGTARMIGAGIPASDIGRVMAGRDEHRAPVVVASVQTLARRSRRTRLVSDWRTLVIDEAHHAPATSYKAILDDLAGPQTLVAGFTATANRKGMDEIWGEPVYRRGVLDGIREGWLSDLRAKRIELDLNFRTVKRVAGDYQVDALARALLEARAPEVVCEQWQEHGENRQTIVFTPTVAVAYAIAEEFERHGIKAEAVDGTSDAETRQGVLERFRDGTTRVLVNCSLFTEGVDIPQIACVVMARPTMSPLLYAQQIGRGLRTAPGKTDCLVLDLAGASKRHQLDKLKPGDGPQDVSDLLGISVADGQSVADASEKAAALAALLSEIQGISMVNTDLFSGDSGARWVRLDGRTAVLSCWQGRTVAVEAPKDQRGYQIHMLGRGGERTETRYASTKAEALAEGESWAAALSGWPAEKWRRQAADERQLAYLRSLRADVDPKLVAQMTRGQVDDLIAVSRARKKLQRYHLLHG